MQYVDLNVWLVHDILMKGDKMGMANSLEVRVPFLDKEVLELAETLPLNYKVRAPKTKVALRGAAEKVIRSKTAEKKKLGFPIPIRVWLREEKYYNRVKEAFQSDAAKEFFNSDLLVKMLDDHRSGKNTNEKTDDSRKIWTVYVFLVWYDRFFGHGKPVHPDMTARMH
jgi:asparagine synthase (glutamine-hydrolysing)